MNTQPPEKKTNSKTLEIHSIFKTIQGEGPYCGHRAIFVRLAGCNLQCPGCDTDYTSTRHYLSPLATVSIIEQMTRGESYLIVITGGEPFRQNLTKLVDLLVDDHIVQIETNGTLPPSPGLSDKAVIVCSPKTGMIHPQIGSRLSCFKYVMHHQSIGEDGLPQFALGHSASPSLYRPQVGNNKPIYLQPMDSYDCSTNKKNQDAVVNSCRQYGYILQLQIHKLIGVE